MKGLLDLPREIRDQIITVVLEARHEPPRSHSGDDNLYVTISNSLELPPEQRSVRWERRPRTAWALLCLNHQLRAETRDVIRRYPMDQVCYEIDAMVAEPGITITWTYAPVLTTRVDTLRIRFRPLTDLLLRDLWGNPVGCSWPHWLPYMVLGRVMMVGASAPRSEQTDRVVTIRRLELDFVDLVGDGPSRATEEELEAMANVAHDPFPKSGSSSRGVEPVESIRARALADVAAGAFRNFLGSELHGDFTEPPNGVLYSRIGRVAFMFDGQLLVEWDVSKILADLDPLNDIPDFFENLREDFPAWKRRVFQLRRERGFDVMSCDDG